MLGDTSKRMLKIEMTLGILVAKNYNSTIRVGVDAIFLLTTIRLKETTEVELFKPFQKSSSEKEVSNLIILYEKINVDGI